MDLTLWYFILNWLLPLLAILVLFFITAGMIVLVICGVRELTEKNK